MIIAVLVCTLIVAFIVFAINDYYDPRRLPPIAEPVIELGLVDIVVDNDPGKTERMDVTDL